MIPKRELPRNLLKILSKINPDTSLMDVISAYIVTILKRNKGNRTHTCKELKIPIRTLRNRICQIESLGYSVPEPVVSYTTYRMLKKKPKTELK